MGLHKGLPGPRAIVRTGSRAEFPRMPIAIRMARRCIYNGSGVRSWPGVSSASLRAPNTHVARGGNGDAGLKPRRCVATGSPSKKQAAQAKLQPRSCSLLVAQAFACLAFTGSVNSKQARIRWRTVPCLLRRPEPFSRPCLKRSLDSPRNRACEGAQLFRHGLNRRGLRQ